MRRINPPNVIDPDNLVFPVRVRTEGIRSSFQAMKLIFAPERSFLRDQKMSLEASLRMQQDLNFLPEPHGQGSFRPTFLPTFRTGSCFFSAAFWLAAIAASCLTWISDLGAEA